MCGPHVTKSDKKYMKQYIKIFHSSDNVVAYIYHKSEKQNYEDDFQYLIKRGLWWGSQQHSN